MSRTHEPNRVNTRILLRSGGIMLACLLAIAGVIYVLVHRSPSPAPPAAIPPQPRLQADAPGERAAVLAVQRAELERYQWIDRRRGIARIPIERAMALVARGVRAEPDGDVVRPHPAHDVERRP